MIMISNKRFISYSVPVKISTLFWIIKAGNA